MLLPHESTVSHENASPSEEPCMRKIEDFEVTTKGDPKELILGGQEPGHTHDMDDDEIEGEAEETTSEHSN